MKRFFMIMAVAGLAIFGTACSSDDNSVTDTPGGVVDTKSLKLTTDKLEVTVGDEIKFNVTYGEDVIADAVITEVGGNPIAKGVWKALKAGTFKFEATKAGYDKSNEITVVVKEKEVIAPEVTPNSIVIDGVKYELTTAVLGVDMYQDGNTFKHRPYVQNGTVYFLYTYQMFKGSSENEDDYENAWGKGGLIHAVQIGVKQDGKELKTPENSPKEEWLFADMYTIVDGGVQEGGIDYEKLLDGKVTLGWAAVPGAFGLKASGLYTIPTETDFSVDYEGEADGIYRFQVKAPGAASLSVKQLKTQKRDLESLKIKK